MIRDISSRLMILIIGIVLGLSMFLGCSRKDDSTDTESANALYSLGSKIENDNIYIVEPNANYTFYKKNSYLKNFSVDFLSSSDIDTDKIEISIDIKTPYTYHIEKVEDEAVDFNLYASYAGINGSQMEELKETNYNQYLTELKKYQEEFEKIDKEKIGRVLHYKIFINFKFKNMGQDEKFEKISIKYKDKLFSVDVGNINLDYSSIIHKKEKGLQMNVLSASEVEIVNNSNGLMTYPGMDLMTTNKNVELNKIYFYNSPSEIMECNIAISNKGFSLEKEWDNTSMSINKNSTISTEITLKNDKFINQYMYQGNEYIVYEYEYGDNKYLTYCEVIFNTKLTGYEMYAHYLDDKDIVN